jgi:hypothetical protein
MAIFMLVLGVVVIVMGFWADTMAGCGLSAMAVGVYGIYAFSMWRSRRWRKHLSAEKRDTIEDIEHRLWFIEEIRRKTDDYKTEDLNGRKLVKDMLDAMRKTKELELVRVHVPDTQLCSHVLKKYRDLLGEIKVLAKLSDYFSRPFFYHFHTGLDRLRNELREERREAAYPYLEKIPSV